MPKVRGSQRISVQHRTPKQRDLPPMEEIQQSGYSLFLGGRVDDTYDCYVKVSEETNVGGMTQSIPRVCTTINVGGTTKYSDWLRTVRHAT